MQLFKVIEAAQALAKARPDCDTNPEVVEVDCETYPGFVLVDLRYDSAGHTALYEYRIKDGQLYLAQD